MDKTLKVEQSTNDKYLFVKYIGHKPTNVVIDVWLRASACIEPKELDNLYAVVLDFTKRVGKELKKRKLPYKTKRVIAEAFESIESWTCSITMISKFSKEEMTEWIVDAFHRKYTESRDKCEKLLADAKANGIDYMQNYHICDDYEQQNDYWEFGLETLKPYHNDNFFNKMDELLEELRKTNDSISDVVNRKLAEQKEK